MDIESLALELQEQLKPAGEVTELEHTPSPQVTMFSHHGIWISKTLPLKKLVGY